MTIKSSVTNKGCNFSYIFIIIEKDGERISKEKKHVELFNVNVNYLNIAEISSGKSNLL